ncbi:hypothetical protein TIFTF001_038830 [Ficus carica]|uniref:Uncharacterized protein n=1 Tax=Ficus carica TaxID=3494 RepID=A0AA88JDG2_FICCA|nr:hypothetical protein TIFTF001_038830 [Ficus carica]
MPRKPSGETYVWDPAKEKKFLEKLEEYLATIGGASGYGSVTMPDESQSYFDFDASMHNSAYRPVLEEDVTPTTGARHLNNSRSGADAGPLQSRGSSGKRNQRNETDEMTFLAIDGYSTQSAGDNVALLRCSSTSPTYLPPAARCR